MPKLDILPSDGVTVAQAAAETGFDRRKILRLIQRGDLPGSVKLEGVTGAWIVPLSEVQRLIAERAA